MKQEEALEILKTGVNVFLTGEPGSGKTYTVNQYIEFLRSHGVEPAVTASTGIAATHLNGLTIHSFCGIGIKDKLTRRDLEKITKASYITKRLKKANVLVIDEISMLESKTLDLVDLVCREVRQSKEPFGGLQIVVVGDFFQLPPISKGGGEPAQFAFKADSWGKAKFTVCYLTEQYRQDDSVFLTMLSAIRLNSFGFEHLESIKTRLIKEEETPSNITQIFSHNFDVDALNRKELVKLSGKAESFFMFSRGQKNFVGALKRGCLSPDVLELKQGAIVMFTKNNLKEGFVNGTLGKVIGFNKQNNYPLIETLKGEEIEAKPMEWAIEEGGKTKAIISQLPLRLAWAITIHKSQGMSLDTAVIDLSRTFEYGQGYVALSRVRRLTGLYLLGYNEKAFLTHPAMREQDKVFRSLSQTAKESIQTTPQEIIKQKQTDFLRVCGGSFSLGKKKKKPSKTSSLKKQKLSTFEQTLVLVEQGLGLEGMAKERALVIGTIITHLEELVMKNKLSQKQVEALLSPELLLSAQDILEVFQDLETDKLQPVLEHFNGKYTYNDLRLIRLLLAF
ncbi:AAA family ATPase [Candidatus Parcubacteria bacterium]|nr:AAA family ATPase [Candidatus Parcubacteria bacterium]